VRASVRAARGDGKKAPRPSGEDLDEAERELLGAAKVEAFIAAPCAPSEPALAVEGGAARRLACDGTALPAPRSCGEGHAMCCYVVGFSAALCDHCDLIQKPGEVVFGCGTCDSELCASCAVQEVREDEAKAREHVELIARVMQLHSGAGPRFVAAPCGVLDMAPPKPLADAANSAECPARSEVPRRRHADEVDESKWKGRGYEANVAIPDKHRDILDQMLAEQERLIQARRLERYEAAKWGVSASANEGEGRPPATEGNLMDEDAARHRPDQNGPAELAEGPLERSFDLTLTLAGDFVDELARGYAQPWFQALLRTCTAECSFRRTEFLARLQDLAFEVQRPILENWGFEGNEQGLYDMTSILLDHSRNAPPWLQEKIDRCLTLLYGGADGILQRETAAMARDELERRHFEGDFLGRVARAPVAAGEVISEAIGQLVDTSPMTPELAAELAAGGMGMDMPSLLASLPPEPEAPAREERSHLEPGEMPGAATPSESSSGPSGASGQRSAGGRTVDELAALMASLPDGGIEDVARDLQAQLEEEQAKRAGRAEALRALKAALLRLPRETAEEQSLADAAAGACAASTARCGAAGRALQALKEHHQQLKEQHEAQLEEREQLGAAEAAARAAVERQAQLATAPSREWARDGPETDALKASKVELAELLAEVDEARLHRRKELKALQQA
ncbi:unnamed protein product, partial [Effrenium voratum]